MGLPHLAVLALVATLLALARTLLGYSIAPLPSGCRDTLHSVELLRILWICLRVQVFPPAERVLADSSLDSSVVLETDMVRVLRPIDSAPPLVRRGATFSRGLATVSWLVMTVWSDRLTLRVLLLLSEDISVDVCDDMLLFRG